MVLIFNIRHDLPMCQKSCNSLRWPPGRFFQHLMGVLGLVFGVGYGGRQNKCLWLKSIWWGKRRCLVRGFVDEIFFGWIAFFQVFFQELQYPTLFHMWLGLSLTESSINWWFSETSPGWCTGFRKKPVTIASLLPLHFWQEKIPQLRPQKLEELPGVGILMTDDRGNFRWKDCEKMESWVMIIEGDRLFFLGVLFQAPQNWSPSWWYVDP